MRLLGDLLCRLQPDEIRPTVNLMLGRGAGVKSGINWATLVEAARSVFGNEDDSLFDDRDGFVDAGEFVRRLAARREPTVGSSDAEALGRDSTERVGREAGPEAAAPPPTGSSPTTSATGVDAGGESGGKDVRDVSAAFEAIASARGRKEKVRRLADLLRGVTSSEAAWIARNAVGEMRTGVQEGLLLEAIAYAAQQPASTVRRALIAAGDVVTVAVAALTQGAEGLAALDVQIGRPIPPMLAGVAEDLGDVFERLNGRLALEWKLDGARVQIHKYGGDVRLWSRRLTDVTTRLPDVAAAAREGLTADQVIVEGEVIVFGADGKPIPFQDVMRRWLRQTDTESAAVEQPASVFLFDCLYVDGAPIYDEPYLTRWATLERVRGTLPTVPRLLLEPAAGPDSTTAAVPPAELERMRAFYATAVAAGHEGVMAKALDAPYTPGRRGSYWLKVKEQATLDLVVIGADWGTGRRHRWLSNYHLGCRDEATGRFLSVGETFKGLTDAQFAWMTEQLLTIQVAQRRSYVAVEPKIVVEVTFNGVQRSVRLPSGVALRFARITRIRDDKSPAEADTLTTLRALLPPE
ncbi:MAG: ATP-dependent DNA ligase [Chloroflexi bacterium]|nr:ATP-dependent DNA ligase [Chloroflexota bacterium]